MSPANFWQLRLEAVEAALSLLNEFSINQSEPVDVFGMCEQAGLWLAFVELDNVLGAYIPEGVGGVLITTQRALPVQRYTAAHELGHWRLEHGVRADGRTEILGVPPAEVERLAQVFAANLLMPPPLIEAILSRVRPDPAQPITGQHCYTLAREAGVSFEAAIRQLANLTFITNERANELTKLRKLAIKTELGFGRRPVNGWADVWPVDEQWDDQTLRLNVEDEIAISLPENRSSGYRWMLSNSAPIAPPSPAPPPFGSKSSSGSVEEFLAAVRAAKVNPPTMPAAVNTRLRSRQTADTYTDVEAAADGGVAAADATEVEVVGDRYRSSRDPGATPTQAKAIRLDATTTPPTNDDEQPRFRHNVVAGATGRRLLGVRLPVPGIHSLRLEYRSPYSDTPPLRSYALHALVETRRDAISIDQLRDDTEAWHEEVRDRQKAALPPSLPADAPIDD